MRGFLLSFLIGIIVFAAGQIIADDSTSTGATSQTAPGTDTSSVDALTASGSADVGAPETVPETETTGATAQTAPGTENNATPAASMTKSNQEKEAKPDSIQTTPVKNNNESQDNNQPETDVTGQPVDEDIPGSDITASVNTQGQGQSLTGTAEQSSASGTEKSSKESVKKSGTGKKIKKSDLSKTKKSKKSKHKKKKSKKKKKKIPTLPSTTMTDMAFSYKNGFLGNNKSLHDYMIWGLGASSSDGVKYDIKNLDDNFVNTAWVPKAKNSVGQFIVFKMDEVYFAPAYAKKRKSVKWTGFHILNGMSMDKDAWRNYARVRKFQVLLNNKPICYFMLHDTMNWQKVRLQKAIYLKPWDVIKVKITDVYFGYLYETKAAITEFVMDGKF